MLKGQRAPASAIRAAAALAGSRSRQWAQGDDDDHDACDDEFSSCGQLDLSAEKRREKEGEEEGFHRGGMEKWTLKTKAVK